MSPDQLREAIRNWAADEPLIPEEYLFGSRARDDYNSDSDVDVAVKLHRQPGDESELAAWLFEKDELSRRLRSLVPFEVDLQLYDPDETERVHKGILKSSIHLYSDGAT